MCQVWRGNTGRIVAQMREVRLIEMLIESGALTRCEPLEKIAHRLSRMTTLSPRVSYLILDMGSRDHITPHFADGFSGYQVSNCCGSFVVAVRA